MTAGNSSPLNDGASAVVLASGEAAAELGVEPLARVVGVGDARARPAVHGHRAGVGDPQGDRARRPGAAGHRRLGGPRGVLAPRRSASCASCPTSSTASRSPTRRLNPNGGAVAIGHPFGSSGTRYVLTLATELRERGVRYGVLGVCVGSGQGVALVLENPQAA